MVIVTVSVVGPIVVVVVPVDGVRLLVNFHLKLASHECQQVRQFFQSPWDMQRYTIDGTITIPIILNSGGELILYFLNKHPRVRKVSWMVQAEQS